MSTTAAHLLTRAETPLVLESCQFTRVHALKKTGFSSLLELKLTFPPHSGHWLSTAAHLEELKCWLVQSYAGPVQVSIAICEFIRATPS